MSPEGGGRETDDRPRRDHRSWRQRLILVAGIATATVCFAAVAFVGYEAGQLGDIERTDLALAAVTNQEPQNWLIVGSDSRDVIARNDPNGGAFRGGGDPGPGQRSDTIMIVRIDPGEARIDMLSLQRDLWVPIARTNQSERINSAYNYPDGPQRLIDTIRTDFKIDINHYVEINFASFEGIVNAIGGVPMYFDKPLRDTNSGLLIDKTGCVRLDGVQALAFARSRHLDYREGNRWIPDESADLGRISRQQFFIRTMFDQVAATALTNPKTVHDLIDVAKTNVGLDRDIDLDDAIALGQRFAQLKGDAIRSYSLPIVPDTTDGGAAILRLVDADAQPILNRFRGMAEDEVAPGSLTVSVDNGSGAPAQAGEVRQALQALGYVPGAVRDSGALIARTQIRYAPGRRAGADQVARHLTSRADLVEDASVASDQLVLVTGKDFTTVMRRPYPSTSLDPAATAAAGSDRGTGGSDSGSGSGSGSTIVPGGSATSTTAAGTVAGQRATSSTTTTTATPLNNTDSSHVGFVPGEPPPGVVCE